MEAQSAARPWPGPRDARALQAALVIVGFVGLISGAYGSGPFFIWLSTLHRAHNPVPLPVGSLVALALPIVPIVLGAWAWRGRRVRRLISVYAMGAGVVGLALGLLLGIVVLAISFIA